MILSGGKLDDARILSSATVKLMGANAIPRNVLVSSNGTNGLRFNEAVGFSLDCIVVNDPRNAASPVGAGTLSWGGAAGTWFWIDPTNGLISVGMVHRFGGGGGDDQGTLARALTYKALTNPEK